MTPDEKEAAFTQAKAAHDKVVQLGSEYQAATTERARLFRLLRDGGVSLYMIGKRLGLSAVRVSQIASRPVGKSKNGGAS